MAWPCRQFDEVCEWWYQDGTVSWASFNAVSGDVAVSLVLLNRGVNDDTDGQVGKNLPSHGAKPAVLTFNGVGEEVRVYQLESSCKLEANQRSTFR